MFDTLIESSKHGKENSRTGLFLFVTSVIYVIGLLGIAVGTILYMNPGLVDALDVATMLAPPPPPQPTPTPPPKQIKVSGGVLQGSALRRVQPQYPPIAKAARASGAVQVQVTISEEGRVIEADVISGHPLLRDAALRAAQQWLFKPTELSGVPVKVQGVLTFNFTLN